MSIVERSVGDLSASRSHIIAYVWSISAYIRRGLKGSTEGREHWGGGRRRWPQGAKTNRVRSRRDCVPHHVAVLPPSTSKGACSQPTFIATLPRLTIIEDRTP